MYQIDKIQGSLHGKKGSFTASRVSKNWFHVKSERQILCRSNTALFAVSEALNFEFYEFLYFL